MPDERCLDHASEDRFGYLLAEILQAEEQGQRPDLEHCVAKFPDLELRLRQFFRDRERFARWAERLSSGPRTVGAADGAPPPFVALKPGMQFGSYEILEELGRGGMGVVYKARQTLPDRLVALKVIRTDRLEGLSEQERRQWIARFYREAQLVAGLDQHPHIVTLYEVGEYEGQPYFTMKLVEGGSLAQRLRSTAASSRSRLEGQRECARLLSLAAQAVDYAHRHGVLHRDLKPGNILLDADHRPLVSDYGLARRLDETGSIVASGIEGTAAYMAPEQARSTKGAITTAADIYGLGAILYDMLTGRPPFQGANDLEILLCVLDHEPTHPCSLDRRLSRDLATISLKCLEKEPSRRYPSAAALAEDLENWLQGRPINARHVGTMGRFWRWCRRQPALASAIGFAVGALLTGTAVSTILGLHWQQAAKDLVIAVGAKEEERAKAVQAQKTTLRLTADLTLDSALSACAEGNTGLGLLRMAQGLKLAPEDATDLDEEIRANLANWGRSIVPLHEPFPHSGSVVAARFSVDGQRLVTLTSVPAMKWSDPPQGRARLWDIRSGKPIPAALPPDHRVLALSPDGHTVLLLTEPTSVQLWDLTSSKPMGGSWEFPHGVSMASFSPDGKTVLLAGKQGNPPAVFMDVETRKQLPDPGIIRGSELSSASFSFDGKFLALVTWRPVNFFEAGGQAVRRRRRDPHNWFQPPQVPSFGPDTDLNGRPKHGSGSIALYDLAQRRPLSAPSEYNQDADAAIAISPDGKLLLTVKVVDSLAGIGPPEEVKGYLWNLETKQAPRQLPLAGLTTLSAFSPDGKVLLTVCDSLEGPRSAVPTNATIQMWDVESGRPLGSPLLQRGTVRAAAFSPDSRLLVTAGGEPRHGEAQLWDVASFRPLGRAFEHADVILAATFSPDGKTILTGGADGDARIWETDPIRPITPVVRLERVAALSPDGSHALVRDVGDALRLVNTTTGKAMGEPVPFLEEGTAVNLAPDNRTILIAGGDKTARLWDGLTGRPLSTDLVHPDPVEAIRFRKDGKIAVTTTQSTEYFWDAGTGLTFGHKKRIAERRPVAESPDGRIELGNWDNRGLMWDGDTWALRGGAPLTGGPFTAALFAPNGQTVLTVGSRSGNWEQARLWDVFTGAALGPPLQHQGLIRAMAFGPNAKWVATAGEDKVARVWSAEGGQSPGQLTHPGRVLAVAFSPDGKTLATGCEDGAVRLWHASGGKLVGPPLQHSGPVSFVNFGPSGRTLVSGGNGNVLTWEIPEPVGGTADEVVLWAEVLTGLELKGGVARPLEWPEWASRSQRSKQSHP